MANIIGYEVISLESYYRSEQVKDFKYDDFRSLDLALLKKNIGDIRRGRKTKVPVFDLVSGARGSFKELEVFEDCGVVIIEGVYALHPDIIKSLDLWVAVVAYQDILKLLDPAKICSSAQNFIDVYLRLSRISANGQLTESDCMRVRICEGRFALLIREPIREGDFIIKPKVDFDITISTVSGLLNLGYQAVAYIEAYAHIYQDGKLLIEPDHLHDVPGPYIQIQGSNKEVMVAAGFTLELDGSYTTKS